MFEHDPFLQHREQMRQFLEKNIRISEKKEDSALGFRLTYCDRKKHRTLSGGAYDHLIKIEPCNHECSTWRQDKGQSIVDEIPNFAPEWDRATENADHTKTLQRMYGEK